MHFILVSVNTFWVASYWKIEDGTVEGFVLCPCQFDLLFSHSWKRGKKGVNSISVLRRIYRAHAVSPFIAKTGLYKRLSLFSKDVTNFDLNKSVHWSTPKKMSKFSWSECRQEFIGHEVVDIFVGTLNTTFIVYYCNMSAQVFVGF